MPLDNDRWNTLFKYANFYNLPSPGQLASSGTSADYAQKSQVLAVYRHVDENVKIGLGYNFTDFSDDLTDLSYRSRGTCWWRTEASVPPLIGAAKKFVAYPGTER